MADMITWLWACLDEDEAAARSWLERSGRLEASVWAANAIQHHIWVLADIAAKRAILDYAERHGSTALMLSIAMDQIVRLLASAYAARPGYRDEWRP